MSIQLVDKTLRDRAAEAACTLHRKDKDTLFVCDVGRRTTDAVLAEVRNWLLERATLQPFAASAAALRVAAGDLGLPEGVAKDA